MANDPLPLILRAQVGDRESFAALFRQYKNLVYKTAYLTLGDRLDAEDVLQEVFLQVHKSLASFDPRRGAFTTWLYRITINYCLNHRRRRSLVSVPLDDDELASEFPGRQLAEEEAIWQAIRRLSDKQQAAVVLRYYWELSYADVAQILEIPLGTVKSRLDLALKTLRRVLEEQEAHSGSATEMKVPHEL
jgi:RNA polymerase sigma-70 factor, ECF subfamily